ncbi:MAG: LicD family protein [Bacteroidales bacterium]|nr:LicD family protein [Bacteroidales bacterium]
MNSAQSGKNIDTVELKSLMLSILKDVDAFCRQNSIRYFLTYGTLLGAVRHKGYIPWDDDIDIHMPRPDYMRFMKEYSHNYYKAYCAEYTPGWDHYIAKVCDDRTIIDEGHGDRCGVYIDVFPLDGWPGDRIRNRIHYCKILLYMKLWSSLHYTRQLKIVKSNSISKNLKIVSSKILGLFCNSRDVLNRLLKIKMRYPFNDSCWVGSLTCGEWSKMPRESCDHLIEGDFEGYKFLMPEHFDEWLTTIYGNYMQLPPEEERVSNHGFTACWK